jgi:hypothetical protein
MTFPGSIRCLALTGATFLLAVSPLLGQDTTRTTKPDTAAAPAPAQPAAPSLPFEFSGVIFANFQYGGLKGNRTQNRFDIDRAYLTFRTNAGENLSIRITADVFQQRDTTTSAFYRGWAFRAKYAYVQYDYLRGVGEELKANVRLGLLHTVVIDREEPVWPRGIQQVAVEQAGYFSSADAGVATVISLPRKFGEIYATVGNGTGYTSRELDRFKDYAVRLSLTPLAKTFGYFKGLDISPWISIGQRASDFADRRRGTVLRQDGGLQKDRYGLLVLLKDPRLALGAQLARRIDIVERADTTRDTAPTTTKRTGELLSLYTLVRPLAFINSAPAWPLGVLLRMDHVKPSRAADPYQRNYIAGLMWDLSKKTSVTFDFQTQEPKKGSTTPDLKTYYLHVIANF